MLCECQRDWSESATLVMSLNAGGRVQTSFPAQIKRSRSQPSQSALRAFCAIFLAQFCAPIFDNLPKPFCMLQRCRFLGKLLQKRNEFSKMISPQVRHLILQTNQSPEQAVNGAVAIAPVAVIGEPQSTQISGQISHQSRAQDSVLVGIAFLGAFCLPFPLPLGCPIMDCRAVAMGVWCSVCCFMVAPTTIHMELCAS